MKKLIWLIILFSLAALLYSNDLSEMNLKGNIKEQIHYRNDDTISIKYIYLYDNKNYLIEQSEYNGNGDFNSKKNFYL